MPSLTAVVADLLAHPRPVLCLDNCDIMEVVQCLFQGDVVAIEPARRLFEAIAAYPNRTRVVLTYLVVHEWNQNSAGVSAKALEHLGKIDGSIARVHVAAAHVGTALPAPAPPLAASTLVGDLLNLAHGLIKQAAMIDRDDPCVERALGRVMNKQRPAHDGHIKDAIHLEHYLELARQFRGGGFAERCIFVSRDKKAFWTETGAPHIHPDLQAELAAPAVRLEFFGKLADALGSLHI